MSRVNNIINISFFLKKNQYIIFLKKYQYIIFFKKYHYIIPRKEKNNDQKIQMKLKHECTGEHMIHHHTVVIRSGSISYNQI